MNIPKGYKLVPVEPTCSMVLAGLKALGGCVGSCGEASPPDGSDIHDAFSEMLAAAPTPPQPIYDEAADLVAFEKWVAEECERDDVEPDFSLVANGEYENDTLNIARRAWLACAQSRAKSVEVKSD